MFMLTSVVFHQDERRASSIDEQQPRGIFNSQLQ